MLKWCSNSKLYFILDFFFQDLVLDDMVNKRQLEQDNRQKVRDALLKKHRHQCKSRSSKKAKSNPISSFPSFTKKHSFSGLGDVTKKSEGIQGSKSVPNNLKKLAVSEEGGEFPQLPSAVDLVGQGRDTVCNIDETDTETNLEMVSQLSLKKKVIIRI